MLSKARYLELKQKRKELHLELRRYKKFNRNSLNIPVKERSEIHNTIISNFNSAKREYRLTTELIEINQQLFETIRKANWLNVCTSPV
jgi:sugar-specific transcriptional regulator TrmB